MKCADCGLPEDRRHLCDRPGCLTRASSPVVATSPYLNKPLRSLAEVEALRADRPAPLFDCSPRIAIKLARCAEIARAQLEATNRDSVYSPIRKYDGTFYPRGLIYDVYRTPYRRTLNA